MTHRALKVALLIAVLQLPMFTGALLSAEPSRRGSIHGRVADSTNHALIDVNIALLSTTLGTISEKDGTFRLDDLLPGRYSLRFSHIGYKTEYLRDIIVQAGMVTEVAVRLSESVRFLQEICITPGHFSITESQSARQQSIEKSRIAAIPATLDDIYRVLQVMPGVAFSDDYSAHFHVRGGKQNENLILLDGIEIYDPYHLKNIGGAVGVMNMDLVDKMSIMTGGFDAKYGDRLSSVVNIENRKGNSERFSGAIGAGGTGLSVLLESPLPHGSGIISYRKSFLKEAAEFLNPTSSTFSPSFYDFQSKIYLTATKNSQFVYNLLYSKDNSYLEKWQGQSDLYSNYGNSYQGIVWKSTWSPHLYTELIASHGINFWENKKGDTEEENLKLQENAFSWNLDAHPHRRHEMACGLSYKRISYTYEIRAEELSANEQELEELVQSYFGTMTISPRTWKLAGYIQDKFQITPRLYLNCGARFDYFDYNADQQISPRLGIACQLAQKTILRAAWGTYYQAPIYAELTNRKGAEYNPQAQKAIHYILGAETFVSNGLSLRVEAYYKQLAHLISHYFEVEQESSLPALKYGNPNSGECKGIEFFINGQISSALSIWTTYSYSKATIEAFFVDWDNLQIEKQVIPRFTDQPHNLSLYINCTLPKSWAVNVKLRYLSGTPYTPLSPQFVDGAARWDQGENYSARYPAYHRLDLRVGKNFAFYKYHLAAFLEVKNLYNRKNVLLYDYRIQNNQHLRKAYYTLPFLPTIEFKVRF